MKPYVTIYTDGACLGNPGNGGYGIVILYEDSRGLQSEELSQGYRKTTNNRMELLAVIKALEALVDPTTVDLFSDSSYVVRSINEGWLESWKKNHWKSMSTNKPVKNKPLWKQLDGLLKIHTVTFHWVKGHNGDQWNERCDELAVEAANGKELLDDKR